MKVSLSLIVFAACLALCACAESTCTASVTFKARQDASATWYANGLRYQIWDITATNSGSCPLTKIVAFFTLSAGGFISESWNYDSASGLFSGFGSTLNAGQSFYGAGMVLANHTSITLGVTRYGCPESCYPAATTQAPTTTAPVTTAAPTTTAPTTIAPTTTAPTTTAPTTIAPTTTAPSSCAVTAYMTRDSYWWMDAGRNTSVYRLSMMNTGRCALQYYSLSFNLGSGALLSYWNLQTAVGGGYLVTGYGPALAAGATFSAAGIIVAGGPDHIVITPLSSRCAC